MRGRRGGKRSLPRGGAEARNASRTELTMHMSDGNRCPDRAGVSDRITALSNQRPQEMEKPTVAPNIGSREERRGRPKQAMSAPPLLVNVFCGTLARVKARFPWARAGHGRARPMVGSPKRPGHGQ